MAQIMCSNSSWWGLDSEIQEL